MSKYVSLIISDSLFGLTKEEWDSEQDMWKSKEFEDLLNFVKVNSCFLKNHLNQMLRSCILS